MKKVAILVGRSLLAQGVISRLNQYALQVETCVIDLAEAQNLEQLLEFQPEFVIFEASDIKAAPFCSLVDLINALPEAIMLELRLDNPSVQKIQSTRCSASNTQELLQLFESGSLAGSPAASTP